MGGIAVGTDSKPCNPTPLNSWIAPISFRQSAATAAPGMVWGIANVTGWTGAPEPRYIYVRKIHLVVAFDGTAAATSSCYKLVAFDIAGDPPPDATEISFASKNRNVADVTTAASVFVKDAGMIVTDITFQGEFAQFGNPRQLGVSSPFSLPFDMGGDERYDAIVLARNQGIGIQLVNTAVIGDTVRGFIEWDEKIDL